MEIFVNGEPKTVSGDKILLELVEDLGLREQRIAVEVNREIVPRSAHAGRRLRAGDRVEIVTAIGGG